MKFSINPIKKCLLSIVFLSVSSFINITAYSNKVLSLTNVKKSHTLCLLSEEHTDTREFSLVQSKQLIHFLRSTNASLIVEDPSSITNGTFSLLELYNERKSKRSVLYHLASLARHSEVTATNIEFRIDTIKPRSKVPVDQFVKETNDVLEEIKGYDDGSIANKYYQEVIARHVDIIRPNYVQLLNRFREKNKGLSLEVELPVEVNKVIALYGAQSIAYFNSIARKQKVRYAIICYNTELIEARLVHAVLMHQKQGKPKTVICAGGAHIDRAFYILLDLGYWVDVHYPVFIKDPLTLNKVLQSFYPDYDPEVELSKTEVDYLLDYCEFENEHPILTFAIPTGLLLAVTSAALYLAKVYISGGNGG